MLRPRGHRAHRPRRWTRATTAGMSQAPARRVSSARRRSRRFSLPADGPTAPPGPYDRLVKRLVAWASALPAGRQDLALAVALAAYNLGSLIPENRQLSPVYLAYALVVLQALPLAWRRSYPILVFIAVGIPRTIYDQLNIDYAPLPLGPAIAYFTVMDRCSTRTRVATSALLLAGIIRSQTLPGHTEPYDFFVGRARLRGRRDGRPARPHPAGVPGRGRGQGGAGRGRAGPAGRARRGAGAHPDRQGTARRGRAPRQPHGRAVGGGGRPAARPPGGGGGSVEIIGTTARAALTELRRLLGVLRGPADVPGGRGSTAPAPSVTELDQVLVQVRQAGLDVDLRVEGSPARLAPGVDLTAYRIVQEALTNTVRHSGATAAAVTVRYEPGYVTVTVADTGARAAGGPLARAPPARPRNGSAAQDGAEKRRCRKRRCPVRRLRAGRDRRAGRVLRRQPDRGADGQGRVRGHGPAAGAMNGDPSRARSRSGSSSSTTRNWSGPDSA